LWPFLTGGALNIFVVDSLKQKNRIAAIRDINAIVVIQMVPHIKIN
jgi:hypothetical protein